MQDETKTAEHLGLDARFVREIALQIRNELVGLQEGIEGRLVAAEMREYAPHAKILIEERREVARQIREEVLALHNLNDLALRAADPSMLRY